MHFTSIHINSIDINKWNKIKWGERNLDSWSDSLRDRSWSRNFHRSPSFVTRRLFCAVDRTFIHVRRLHGVLVTDGIRRAGLGILPGIAGHAGRSYPGVGGIRWNKKSRAHHSVQHSPHAEHVLRAAHILLFLYCQVSGKSETRNKRMLYIPIKLTPGKCLINEKSILSELDFCFRCKWLNNLRSSWTKIILYYIDIL